MTLRSPAPPKIFFIDDPRASEFFAEEAAGFFLHSGTVSITFCSVRCDHGKSPGPINKVVVSRLIMPVAGAQSLAVGLFNFLKQRDSNSPG